MFHQSWRRSNVFEPTPTFAIEYMLIYAEISHTNRHAHTHDRTERPVHLASDKKSDTI